MSKRVDRILEDIHSRGREYPWPAGGAMSDEELKDVRNAGLVTWFCPRCHQPRFVGRPHASCRVDERDATDRLVKAARAVVALPMDHECNHLDVVTELAEALKPFEGGA